MSDETPRGAAMPTPAVRTPDGPERPVYGFWRRWVLRAILWGFALLVCILFLGQMLLDTARTREWARQEIVTRVGTLLDREVKLAAVSFELLPLTLEVRGLEIGGGPDFPDAPFLTLERAEVEADVNALLRRKLHLRLVKLERPRVDLRMGPGTDNLFDIKSSGEPSAFELLLDRVEVDRGAFLLDEQEIELSFAAEGLRTRLQDLGRKQLSGPLVAERIELRLPKAEPLDLTLGAQITLTPKRVDLADVRLAGDGIELTAAGGCDWSGEGGQGNKCVVRTQGNAQGALVARLGYFDEVAGDLAIEGTLTWRAGATGWRGALRSERLRLFNFDLDDFESRVVADRFGVRVELDRATYGAGRLQGEILVDLRVPEDPLSVDVQVAGLDVGKLFGDLGIPVRGLATLATGRVRYTAPMRDGLSGDGEGDLMLSAPPGDPALDPAGAAAGPYLPLAGSAPLVLRDGVLRLGQAPQTQIALAAPGHDLLVSGAYDLRSRRGDFHFEVATAAAEELLAVAMEPPEGPTPPWMLQGGRGRVGVDLAVEPAAGFKAAVVFELEDVVTPRLAGARAQGRLELSAKALESMRIDISRGSGALTLAGRVPFGEGQVIEIEADSYTWPLAELKPWVEFDLPLDGNVSGHLELTLAPGGNAGSLNARLRPARVLDAITLDELAARLSFDKERVTFRDVEARSAAGTVRGAGSLRLADSALDFQVRGAGLDLAAEPLAAWRAGNDLGGALSLTAQVGGTASEPRVEADIDLERFRLGQQVLEGRTRVHAGWDGQRVDLDARLLDAVTVRGGGLLRLAEEIEPAGPGRPAETRPGAADVTLGVEVADLALLGRVLAPAATILEGGDLAGQVKIQGDPADPQLDIALDRVRVQLVGHELQSRERAVVRRQEGRWLVEGLRLEEGIDGSGRPATSLRVSGELMPALNLEVDARLAAQWLELYLDPSYLPRGSATVAGRVTGTFTAPELTGRGELEGLSLALPGLGEGLRDLRGDILFQPGQIDLRDVSGQLLGGTVRVQGGIDLPQAERPLGYALQAEGRNLGFRHTTGVRFLGDVDLTFRSTDRGHLVAGRADLQNLEFRQDIKIDIPQLLRDFLRRQRLEVTPVEGILGGVELNLQVKADKTVRVRNNLADLVGSADFTLRGTLASPVLYGEVAIERGGKLVYNGSDYIVERGRLIFSDPFKIDPEIDLVARTRVRDFDIDLSIFGTFSRLETRFSSQPPLPDVEVFRLLAEGDFGAEEESLRPTSTTEEGSQIGRSAATFLYGQAASAIGERVGTLFGFDKFRVDPLIGSGGDNLATARVTVGKRLSKDIFVTYSVDPSSTETQRLQVEWRLSESLVLVLTQNGDNTYSADARWDATF